MKKVLFTSLTILLLAAGCNKQPAPVQPAQNQQASQQQQTQPADETANWKNYTSKKLGLSFKYPKEWGEVKEDYYDSATAKTKSEMSPKGKVLSIKFSDIPDSVKFPYITAESSDYGQWEGPIFTGGNLEVVYKGVSDYKTKPVYFNLGGVVDALKVVTTNFQIFEAPAVNEIDVYANLKQGDFSGLRISQQLSQARMSSEGDEAAQKQFISDYESGKLSVGTQEKIDDFNKFLSTFKFTK